MRNPVSDEVNRPQNEPYNAGQGLLERAFARENLKRAWRRVKANEQTTFFASGGYQKAFDGDSHSYEAMLGVKVKF